MQLDRPPPRMPSLMLPTKVADQQLNQQPTNAIKISNQAKRTSTAPTTKDGNAVNNPYTEHIMGKCFRCNQPGHRFNECPTHQSLNMIEGEENDSKEEISDEEEGEFVEGDEGEMVNCLTQQVLLTSKHDKKTQRHKIFKICDTINNKVCS